MDNDRANEVVEGLEELIRVMILAGDDSLYYSYVTESKGELVRLLTTEEG